MSKRGMMGGRRARLWLSIGIAFVIAGLQPVGALAIQGNLGSASIQIDSSANVFPGDSTKNCSTASFSAVTDWVTDCAANTDSATLVQSIATGLIPGVTSKAGGTGHWAGVRIVDGIAGDDQDIFLTGGKENDTSTWNVGPGSVGSSKYDATQAYLANNQQDLFFGMERRGNNGTTAFDFEFNQNAPAAGENYIPTRTNGDVLWTFEMQGAGNSGSAVPYYFIWSASLSKYVEQTTLPAGTEATINTNTTTPSAPWGRVDTHGNWVGDAFERFAFAEAKVPLTSLPGVSACGGGAYVQVRTRSSAEARSDLKDTTKIFEFLFGSPVAQAAISTNCLAQFTYSGAGSTNASGGTTGLTHSWAIGVSPTTVTLSGGGVSAGAVAGSYTSTQSGGTVSVNFPSGVDSATVTVNNTIFEGTCSDDSGNKVVTVYRILGASASITPKCDNTFDYLGSASGGRAPYTFAWQFQRNSLANATGTWTTIATSALTSGTVNAGVQGAYRALLNVTDSAGTDTGAGIFPKPVCSVNVTTTTINVYNAVGGSVALTPDCDNTFTYSSQGTGGLAPYTYAFTLQKLNATTSAWETSKTFSQGPFAGAATGTLDINDVTIPAGLGGEGRYRLRVTITDSQGLVCTFDATSNEVDIRNLLTASASKQSADGTALTVTLGGSSGSGAALQWQRFDGSNWINLSGATSATLVYSSFEADDLVPTATGFFNIGSGDAAGTYTGKVWVVVLRLRGQRTLNGVLCTAFSDNVTVKKITAVDP